ncbi:hypothetical protein BJ875DRAFT_371759, partial [Amylocarpus encephaloides]
SWYGTWPRKSSASTQVARETILADKPKNGAASSADLSRFEPKKSSISSVERPPSMVIGKSKETLDVNMDGILDDTGPTCKSNLTGTNTPKTDNTHKKTKEAQKLAIVREDSSPSSPSGGSEVKEPVKTAQTDATQEDSNRHTQRPATASGWFGGWLGNPYPQHPDIVDTNIQEPKESDQRANPDGETGKTQTPTDSISTQTQSNQAGTISYSWFGFWPTAPPSDPIEAQVPVEVNEVGGDAVIEDAPTLPSDPAPATTSGSWAFWSSDTAKKSSTSVSAQNEVGHVAISGEPSQNSPEPAKLMAPDAATLSKKTKTGKRNRPLSTDIDEQTKQSAQSETSTEPATVDTTTTKSQPPNLLIPSVRQTYRLVENLSILQQLARLLLLNHQPPAKHVYLAKEPPKIKRALAIGIHGLFPAPLLRTVIGQPTGTSIRFANHAAAAIRRWTDKHGISDCEIEKVALEGEGRITERVDSLWKLLLNWIDHIRKADFILVACHSQGVPVAIMLVAKLIEFGVVSNGRIGVCAMAGVSLGPFPDYKSRYISGSAGELFEFANPESAISKRLEDSLRVALKYGARITYVSSIDDQLVAMESAIFSPASHPHIYRAVFVDGRIHAPDFLSHLVGFALKLRNLGVSDHGLIRELSAPLAGSLYTGEGHSRLYDDGKVYDSAIEYALETTSAGDVPLDLKKYEIPNTINPYVLPWIMRGLLEEEFVKTELSSETLELLKQFDDWKPATKVLKDVKYRLEAVRSKL